MSCFFVKNEYTLFMRLLPLLLFVWLNPQMEIRKSGFLHFLSGLQAKQRVHLLAHNNHVWLNFLAPKPRNKMSQQHINLPNAIFPHILSPIAVWEDRVILFKESRKQMSEQLPTMNRWWHTILFPSLCLLFGSGDVGEWVGGNLPVLYVMVTMAPTDEKAISKIPWTRSISF